MKRHLLMLKFTQRFQISFSQAQVCRLFQSLLGGTEKCTDTTSTTLTYLFWELSKHPEWQFQLRGELNAQEQWLDGIASYKEVTDLRILDAIINEALRLHPAAPASLQRETPAGGRNLNNVFIPEKVRLCLEPIS